MRAWAVGMVVAGSLSLSVPSALANAVQSTNWAGYAVHRAGVSFTQVQGTWREPRLKCTPDKEGFSSYWVGIGGYSLRSRALEQTGTEVDCTSDGASRAFAWYELIPAPSVPVGLEVFPGDLIKGTVTVRGKDVRVALADLTDHHRFSRNLRADVVDVSSAEWIVEAPSSCTSTNTCVTLPLDDFGSTTFSGAHARSASGAVGSIADPLWGASQIDLVPQGQAARLDGHRLGRGGEAIASGLYDAGSSFKVSYAPLRSRSASPAQVRVFPRQLEHPGR